MDSLRRHRHAGVCQDQMKKMIPNRGLHTIPGFDVCERTRELAARSWQVFILPSSIKDTKSFFDGIRAVVPLDPPVLSDDNWDALSDSLWGGLDRLDAEKIAIVWPGSAQMANAQPEAFGIARSILSSLTNSLADPDATLGNEKQVLVVLA